MENLQRLRRAKVESLWEEAVPSVLQIVRTETRHVTLILFIKLLQNFCNMGFIDDTVTADVDPTGVSFIARQSKRCLRNSA